MGGLAFAAGAVFFGTTAFDGLGFAAGDGFLAAALAVEGFAAPFFFTGALRDDAGRDVGASAFARADGAAVLALFFAEGAFFAGAFFTAALAPVFALDVDAFFLLVFRAMSPRKRCPVLHHQRGIFVEPGKPGKCPETGKETDGGQTGCVMDSKWSHRTAWRVAISCRLTTCVAFDVPMRHPSAPSTLASTVIPSAVESATTSVNEADFIISRSGSPVFSLSGPKNRRHPGRVAPLMHAVRPSRARCAHIVQQLGLQ